jgi:hypothetical protein
MSDANSIAKASQRSLFRRAFDLPSRREKCSKIAANHKINIYFPLVVEYSLGINQHRDYEL